MQRVTLLGLGIMGSGMARNLLDAGFNLTVYNRTHAKTRPFAEMGANIASTPRVAVQNAEIIISMVSNDEASRALWTGEDGILAGVTDGAICIEASTLSLEWTHALAAMLAEQGLPFLDCPVGGSKEAANGGHLVVMAGGDPDTLERARPVLEAYSDAVNHLGPTGAGMATKLVFNHLVGLEMLMMAEGLAFAERLGIDRERYLTMIGNSAVGSPFMRRKAELLRDHSYDDPHFMLRWMRKDLSNVLRAGDDVSAALPLAGVAREIYQMAQAAGLGDHDFAAVYAMFAARGDGD